MQVRERANAQKRISLIQIWREDVELIDEIRFEWEWVRSFVVQCVSAYGESFFYLIHGSVDDNMYLKENYP